MAAVHDSGDDKTEAVVAEQHPSSQQRLAVPSARSGWGTGAKHRTGKTGDIRRTKLKPLKRLERYISAFFKLGRTETMAKQALKRLDAIETLRPDVKQAWQSISRLEKRFEEHDRRFDREAAAVRIGDAALARSMSGITQRIDMLLLNRDTLATDADPETEDEPVAGVPLSEGFEAFKDDFYHRLENRYRGAPEEIARRLRIYLPDVEAAVLRTGQKPVMDIGCGRGEWLGLLSDMGVEAFGVDTNAVQLDEARGQGHDVRHGDAVTFLAESADESLSVISAHHLIEHLPFDVVAWITREAMRVLAPGGLLLFETPNPANVLVGATTFHTDPTHLKPMPAPVMEVLLETAGFHPVELRHLHPHGRFEEFLAKPDFNNDLASLMFGPQDLAVLGTKPSGD